MKLLPATEWQPGKEGLFADLPAETYHAAPGVSHSMLKNSEPPARLPVYMEEKREVTADMVIGTCVHSRILEPDKPLPKLILKDRDFRSNENKKWRDDHLAAGRIILSEDQFSCIAGCVDSLASHKYVRGTFKSGFCEVSGFVKCPEAGLLRKSRIDHVMDAGPGVNFLSDIKTFTGELDEDSIGREVASKRYYTQGAYYLDNWNLLNPDDQRTAFLFWFVEKSPPYLVRPSSLEGDEIALGRERNLANLKSIADCQSSGTWPGFSSEPVKVKLPDYFIKKQNDAGYKRWATTV